MACSLSHTDSEVEALVQKLIDEDKGRQNAILNLALQFENSCTAKDDLRNAYEKCNDILQESHALIDSFLKEGCSSSQADLYFTEKELHQLHLDEEVLRETLEEQAMDEKTREEKIRQKQADDDEFFMEFGVEYSLDIDDSDLHLTPVLRSSSSTCVEPSPYIPNPVTIIPDPAGVVQRAKLLRENVFILDSDEDLMSTQEYMQKVVKDVGDDDDFNSRRVKFCSPNALGDLNVTMKDLSGTIHETVHHKVIGEGGYAKDITVGAAMILVNVSVFTPKPSEHYLNITMRNVVKGPSEEIWQATILHTLNKLSSRVNLDRRGTYVGLLLCPICMDDVETVNHIFFSCNMAKDLWSLFAIMVEIDISVWHISEWFNWLDDLRVSSK
ncbi:protein phosphatase, partial [Tanacetum coccineum]